MKTSKLLTVTICVVVLLSILSTKWRSMHYGYKEDYMPGQVVMSARLRALFSESKLLCFGRYALEVPNEARLIVGDASFPSTIDVVPGGYEIHEEMIKDDIVKLMRKNKTAQVTFNGPGPVDNSRQIRYYEGESDREYGLLIFKTYHSIDDYTYILTASIYKGENENSAAARDALRVRSLRSRDVDQVPTEAGYCIDRGFVTSDRYDDQEMISVGIYLPSFPDVTLSINSNKNAYSDFPKAEFEKMKRDELTLLARINLAQEAQGAFYPARTVLREGKRAVQHWLGEESLIKRTDGTHDFEWSFIGTPKDVVNPSVYDVGMFTKVAHNTVGAAEKASLTDDEAVALWDKLLSGLKFRAKVPGAPEGSYYFLPSNNTNAVAKP